MANKFDVVIVGTGPGGGAVANKLSKHDLNVAVIDSRGYGGTCPLRGCNPKKVLASAAALIDKNERMQHKGIYAKGSISWKELMAFKRTFTDPVPDATEKGFKEAGVTTYHGHAAFVSDQEIRVNDQILQGDKIVIATGADPVPLPIEGKEHLTLSEDFLELDRLPTRIIFVGGGYVSFELAHIAARAGSQVDIIQRGDHPLKMFDPDLVKRLINKTEAVGINVHLNTSVQSIEKGTQDFTVKAEKNNEVVTFTGDIVVHGGGRAPNIAGLNLKQGNVDNEKTGVSVNAYLQSVSNPHVYAIGDVADTAGAPLTPVAQLEAEVISKNITKENKQHADYSGVPSAVFTTPMLARAGMSVQQAKDAGYNVTVNDMDIAEFFTYQHTNEDTAAVKIIIDKGSDHILGAHLLGGDAGELINYFAMAIQLKLTTNDMKQVTYAFPTAVSDIPSMLS